MKQAITVFYDEHNRIILEEPFQYRRLFKRGQDLIIDSVHYTVDRCNVGTKGDVIVYVNRSLRKF